MRNRNAPAQKDLSIQMLNRIRQLFHDKGWPFDGELDECYFDNFCKMMQSLSEDQQEMILSLSKDFLWVQEIEYMRYFLAAFDMFIGNLDATVRRTIVIAPLLPQNDFGKPKSSVSLFYSIISRIVNFQRKYNVHNIVLLESLSTFDISSFTPDSLFCLIDDFVGSGETAISAVQYFLDNGVDKSKLYILTLVAMQQGIDCLQQQDLKVFSGIIKHKAISDRTDGKAELYCELMQEVETKIKVREEYTFGYAHSEGLVKMMRTPNNTFPIYWLKNGKNKNAPFPR